MFFPIVNGLFGAAVGDCEPTVPGVACDLATLRSTVAAALDRVTLAAKLDGLWLHDLQRQRVQSPELVITFPADSITGAAEGAYAPNVSDGYWVMLPPLDPGKHTICFKGTFEFPGGPTIDVTYDLLVQ